MGCLDAKIDLKSSEMAGNESKINKRNNFNNNFHCSLFLISMYSSYDKKKKNHYEYLSLNRK